jgi:hypothetical protein
MTDLVRNKADCHDEVMMKSRVICLTSMRNLNDSHEDCHHEDWPSCMRTAHHEEWDWPSWGLPIMKNETDHHEDCPSRGMRLTIMRTAHHEEWNWPSWGLPITRNETDHHEDCPIKSAHHEKWDWPSWRLTIMRNETDHHEECPSWGMRLTIMRTAHHEEWNWPSWRLPIIRNETGHRKDYDCFLSRKIRLTVMWAASRNSVKPIRPFPSLNQQMLNRAVKVKFYSREDLLVDISVPQ